MALIAATCSNCGGNIDVDENRESGFCPFCGTQYYTEKIINNTYVTNNYTVTVQGVDVENYIKLIVNALNTENVVEARKYLQEAFPSAPDNKQLAFLKIRTIILQLKADIDYKDLTSNHISFNSYVQREKAIQSVDFMGSYKEISECLKSISPNDALLASAFSLVIENFLIYKSFLHTTYKYWDVKNINNKDSSRAEFLKQQSLFSRNNLYNCLCAIFCIACEPLATSPILDNMVQLLFNDAQEGRAKNDFSGIIDRSKVILHNQSIYSLPDLKVVNKKGKEKDASTIGTFLVYFIQLNHPNYNSPTFDTLQNYVRETDQGCYIATCVYDSYDCPQVWTLRRYRDDFLAASWYGRMFIKIYYTVSPTSVKLFGNQTWFRKYFRKRLDALVQSLNESGVQNTPYEDKEW